MHVYLCSINNYFVDVYCTPYIYVYTYCVDLICYAIKIVLNFMNRKLRELKRWLCKIGKLEVSVR